MKILKNLLTVILIVFAVVAAYAGNVKHLKPLATIFYAIQTTAGNPNLYTWQSSIPPGYSCMPNIPATACSVLSDNGIKPADNTRIISPNYHYMNEGMLNIKL